VLWPAILGDIVVANGALQYGRRETIGPVG